MSTPPAAPNQSLEDYGLKLVIEHSTANIDVVAIHGHGGHWQMSWTDRDSGVFWLRDLLPTIIPESRILSFGYNASNASNTSVEDIAVTLLSELFQLRRDTGTIDRALIFLASSFGGLLTKGALGIDPNDTDSSELSKIISSTHGIMFFGVPKNVEDSFGNLGEMAIEEGMFSDSPLIKALSKMYVGSRYQI